MNRKRRKHTMSLCLRLRFKLADAIIDLTGTSMSRQALSVMSQETLNENIQKCVTYLCQSRKISDDQLHLLRPFSS